MAAALARERQRRAEATRRKRFSTGRVRGGDTSSDCRTAGMILVEMVAELLPRRIRTSRSSLCRFLDRHGITLKKGLQAEDGPRAPRRRWLREQGMLDPIRLVFFSTRPRSATIWCGSNGLRGAFAWSITSRL